MSKDLRTFLADVAAEQPGVIKRVDTEVDRRFGITAYDPASETVEREVPRPKGSLWG